MLYRAPDRSLLQIDGVVDFNAPAIQVLYSPVTGTPITLTSLQFDGMVPRLWRIVRVVEYPPADAPTWTDTILRNNGSGNLEDKNATPLPSAMTSLLDDIKQKIGSLWIPLGVAAVSAVALYALFNRRR